MYYIVQVDYCTDTFGCENFTEVENILKIATLKWTQSEFWKSNQTAEELYIECMKEKDFGDIAQVYEIDCFFMVGDHKVPCGLYETDYNKPMTITKIM